ncbi:MAG: helix-turn-helix domain-containing protein [Legionella sp.]|jgi:putative transcriptional regulator|nr:helix-turn-helix domain-containing protein [Legionella sp.]
MTKLQETIDDIAQGLHRANIIDKQTLNNFSDEDLPELHEYTGEEIQNIRKKQKISQAIFAKYLNISPATVRSLEQGKRHAHGAILKLLNIVEQHGLRVLG